MGIRWIQLAALKVQDHRSRGQRPRTNTAETIRPGRATQIDAPLWRIWRALSGRLNVSQFFRGHCPQLQWFRLSACLQLIAVASILFLSAGAQAQTTNAFSPSEIQGQQLAADILAATPVTNFTQTGTLRIHGSNGTTNIPITFATEVAQGLWQVIYNAKMTDAWDSLKIVHQNGQPNQYLFYSAKAGSVISGQMHNLNQSQIMSPFAGSDFWIADLGLEFFHWPEQKVTGHQTRRTRACAVLESENPNPSDGGYSRVVTWIDNQTLGIIYAEAYDANDKLLKVFEPKRLKKVNGQWELQDIEIRNVQTHSRTSILFNTTGDS
jgi:Outer membrane lipoprotein-sorting protein